MLSFLPQGIGEIGAAIIGPTKKGPAFVPTTITSFSEFENTFGGYDTQYYVPYTVREYLDNGAPSVTIVRVLGIGGYQTDSIYLRISSSAGRWRIWNSSSIKTFKKKSYIWEQVAQEVHQVAAIGDNHSWSAFALSVAK